MSFFGKEFKLVKQENFEEFINAVATDLSADQKNAVINHKPTVKIVQSGDSYTLTSSKPGGGSSETKFKSGEQFDDAIGDLAVKSTITVNGNVFTQVQLHPKGTLTIKREFSDDELVATITSSTWNGEVKRYYKA